MKVKFQPQNIEVEIKPGQSVLHAAQDHQIHIKSVCRGVPSCAECRVRVVAGEYNVIPPSSQELGLIGTAWFVDQRRLSCQLRCFGDITVDLTEQVDKAETSKKPRGRYNKDELQESRAVMGNLVMKDEEDEKPASESLSEGQSAGQAEGEGEESARPRRPMPPPKPIAQRPPQKQSLADAEGDEDFDDEDGDESDDESLEGSPQAPAGSPGGPGGKKRRRRRGRRGKRRGGGGGGGAGPSA